MQSMTDTTTATQLTQFILPRSVYGFGRLTATTWARHKTLKPHPETGKRNVRGVETTENCRKRPLVGVQPIGEGGSPKCRRVARKAFHKNLNRGNVGRKRRRLIVSKAKCKCFLMYFPLRKASCWHFACMVVCDMSLKWKKSSHAPDSTTSFFNAWVEVFVKL